MSDSRVIGDPSQGPRGILLFSNTAYTGNTVQSTTTETAFASTYIFDVNELVVGNVIEVVCRGSYGTTTPAPNLTLKMKLGSTVILSTGVMKVQESRSGKAWNFQASIHIFTVGASGTIDCQGDEDDPAGTATITIDTTISQALTVTAQWGTASALNTITLRQFSVRKL